MSAAGAATRQPLDRYDTPPWATEVLLRLVPELCGRLLFDPCCGDTTMAWQVSRGFEAVQLNDIDPSIPIFSHRDLLDRSLWESVRPDWTVTNPPFKLTGEVIERALEYSRCGVALLLRLSTLEVCAGRDFLMETPPSRTIVLPRIKFRGRGHDSVTVAWFVWGIDRSLSGPPLVLLNRTRALGIAGTCEPVGALTPRCDVDVGSAGVLRAAALEQQQLGREDSLTEVKLVGGLPPANQAPKARRDRPLLALTIHQPWAWAIANIGKHIENRTWEPKAEQLKPGDYLALHAGKTTDYEGIEALERELGIHVPSDLPTASIVAVARYAGIYQGSLGSDVWYVGPVGWRITEVVAIRPIPCRGYPDLWEVPKEVHAQVRQHWLEARKVPS